MRVHGSWMRFAPDVQVPLHLAHLSMTYLSMKR
jgi:hypothetical protein